MNEIKERLARIEGMLSSHIEDHKQVKGLLIGDRPEKGIVVRLDRLEQTEKRRSKLVWLAIAAGMSSLVSHVFPFLRGAGK